MWKALRAQGIFRGQGPAPKVAFLYTGQGSQYVNMLQRLRAAEPIVAADVRRSRPRDDAAAGQAAQRLHLRRWSRPCRGAQGRGGSPPDRDHTAGSAGTELALTRLLAAYGIQPDMTMGHSLGEYGALVAAGALPFADALEAVSARGREMTRVAMDDNGRMAAVFAPLDEIEAHLEDRSTGYVVIANINSQQPGRDRRRQPKPSSRQLLLSETPDTKSSPLPVSHAFHTSIVAPASEPMRRVLERLHLQAPRVPIVANLDGEFYPTGPDVVPRMLDILARQIASPVQFVKGLHTLYEAGARVFVEVGPKKALQGFAEDVLGGTGHVMSSSPTIRRAAT